METCLVRAGSVKVILTAVTVFIKKNFHQTKRNELRIQRRLLFEGIHKATRNGGFFLASAALTGAQAK